jgi:sugar phosphate isomerase/epimerase
MQHRYILTAYGMPHAMGYLATRDGAHHNAPLSVIQLMDAAAEMGLHGVEFPLRQASDDVISALADALKSRQMSVVADYMIIVDGELDDFRRFLKQSARLGATVARAIMSNILCGDRRTLPGGWDERLKAVAGRLRELLPVAQDLGLCIALENHQDATTADFLKLNEMSGNHPAFGITLDTGNPLSVGEDPIETAKTLAPLIRHIHLKDYTIHFAPEGYRLVRCAAGDGVIDFKSILDILSTNGRVLTPGVEIAAQPTRTIPLLDPGWWTCHTQRDARELLSALKILWAKGKPMNEPYSSAWERGCDSQTVAAEEWDVVRKSAAYFRGLS